MAEPATRFKTFACVADTTAKATSLRTRLDQQFQFIDIDQPGSKKPDCIIILGGDGFMLECLHKYMNLNVPFFGINCGTVGFLMNRYREEGEPLKDRIHDAHRAQLHPLRMFARTVDGKEFKKLAINEVSLLRETRQAAKIRVMVDHVVRIEEMVCDGVLVSTPAGSTAYNCSANGPILPLQAKILALTPISPFRPRRWRGALIPDTSSVFFEILEAQKRPVSAVADFHEIRDVTHVEISEFRRLTITLLFDPQESLQERMVREQFML